jgi:hypothetical protein
VSFGNNGILGLFSMGMMRVVSSVKMVDAQVTHFAWWKQSGSPELILA